MRKTISKVAKKSRSSKAQLARMDPVGPQRSEDVPEPQGGSHGMKEISTESGEQVGLQPLGVVPESLFEDSDDQFPPYERSTEGRAHPPSDSEDDLFLQDSESSSDLEILDQREACDVAEPTVVPARRIPKKVRRPDDDDEDYLAGLAPAKKSQRITHTVATIEPPKPLTFGGNGDQSIPTERIRQFFDQLATWRLDSNNQGPIGDRRRNDFLIDGSLHGWLFTNASDPEYSDLGKPWEEFTDAELQEAITRWNGDTTTGVQTVTTTIDELFSLRLNEFMQVGPKRGSYQLSALWPTIRDRLKPHRETWEASSSAKKREWVIRLMQVLLDPRLHRAPTERDPPPTFEESKIPPRFRTSTQMCICLTAYRIIMRKMETSEPDWRVLNLRQYNPFEKDQQRYPFQAIDSPEQLYLFLMKLVKGIYTISVMAKAYQTVPDRMYPDDVVKAENSASTTKVTFPRKDYTKPPFKDTNNRSSGLPQGSRPMSGQGFAGSHRPSNGGGSNSVTGPVTTPVECYACGRINHHGSVCRFKAFPGANPNPNIRWKDSPEGRPFREFDANVNVLPAPKKVMGQEGKKTFRRGMSFLNALLNNSQICGTNAIICYMNYRIQKQALIDTGANSSDYVSSSVAAWLRSKGMAIEPPTQPFVHGAWQESRCRILGTVKALTIKLENAFHQPIMLELFDIKIIEGNFDLILGLPTIRRYDLTKHFRSLFQNEDGESSVTVKKNQTGQTTTPTTSIEGYVAILQSQPDWLCALSAQEIAKADIYSSNSPAISEKHRLEYAKDDLLDILADDEEDPLWMPTITNLLPGKDDKLDESNLPDIGSGTKFQSNLRRVMVQNSSVFARTIGPEPARIEPMKLELDNRQVFQSAGPPRPQSTTKQQALIEQLNMMLKLGLIVRSQATNYSQVVMVAKPNRPGAWRFCVDYRRLNECLISMGWPIPNIDRLFARLGSKRARFFAVLDLTSGYHQILLDPETRKVAAFITDYGVFEPVRLWMGIKSAPSYFQQKMTQVLHGLLYDICEIYIDDIIIFGRTEQEFLHHLNKVLQRLREYNLTLNPDKAKIGVRQLEYVGRVINEHGVTMSDEKIRKVVEFPLPTTPKQLKQFLGLVNYFRAHVKNFAHTATPLYALTEGYNESPSRRHSKLKWSPEHSAAFEKIKDAIRANPLLHFVDEQLPIHVATDASDYGVGAYLYQTRQGEDGVEEQLPVAFLSQSLTKVQQRWSTIEKECYAIWYALRKWEHLLRDVHFTIYTDHRNLKYLNTNTPKVVRWKLAIQEFDFHVRHIEGTANVVADAFSRLCTQDEEEDESFDGSETRKSLFRAGDVFPDALCSVTGLCPCSSEDVAYLCGLSDTGAISAATTHSVPKGDRVSQRKRRRSAAKRPPDNSKSAIPYVAEEIIHPVASNLHDVSMTEEQFKTIQSVHNEMEGHMGFHLTMQRLKAKGTMWPFVRLHVRKFITECPTCQALRRITPLIKTLPYVTASQSPMERISIDTMGPFTKSRNYEYILVVIDNFSRYVELFPLTSVAAHEAAEKLLEHCARYGQPIQILSDGGTQFLNETVSTLCKMLQVTTITATPYSKQENGIVERANKEVLRHLRAFIADSKILESWSSYLPLIQRIMNATTHSVLGVSPASIVFGDATRLDRRVLNELPNENYDEETGELLPPNPNMSPTLRAWIDRMLAAQHRIIQIARQNQEEEQVRHLQEKTPEDAPIIFKPEEYVMCDYPTTAFGKQPPNKLLLPTRGPFRVINYDVTKRKYILQHLNSNRTFTSDPSRVHKFNYDPARTKPAEVALRDKQEFYVQAIHGVKGHPQRKKTLQFLVQWEGYDERTWEPWSHLRNNIILHKYLLDSPNKELRKLAKSNVIEEQQNV